MDRDGNAILNSAGDPYDPPVEGDDNRWQIVVRKNIAQAPPWLLTMKDAINNGPWAVAGLSVPDKQAKLMNIEIGEWQVRNQIEFYLLSFTASLDQNGWDKQVLDAGMREVPKYWVANTAYGLGAAVQSAPYNGHWYLATALSNPVQPAGGVNRPGRSSGAQSSMAGSPGPIRARPRPAAQDRRQRRPTCASPGTAGRQGARPGQPHATNCRFQSGEALQLSVVRLAPRDVRKMRVFSFQDVRAGKRRLKTENGRRKPSPDSPQTPPLASFAPRATPSGSSRATTPRSAHGGEASRSMELGPWRRRPSRPAVRERPTCRVRRQWGTPAGRAAVTPCAGGDHGFVRAAQARRAAAGLGASRRSAIRRT